MGREGDNEPMTLYCTRRELELIYMALVEVTDDSQSILNRADEVIMPTEGVRIRDCIDIEQQRENIDKSIDLYRRINRMI